ncbi:hypothetical protein O9992_24845 [Vibrio lentus]|nr:hypothetical protein [Vibrio lentus]
MIHRRIRFHGKAAKVSHDQFCCPVNIDAQSALLDADIAWEVAGNADSVLRTDNSYITMNDDKEIVGGTALESAKDSTVF